MWMDVMHNWFEHHPNTQMPLMKTLIQNVYYRFIPRRIRDLRAHQFADPSKGQELIDSFVDKDFNTRRSEVAEHLIAVKYHTSLRFLRRFALLEMVVKDLFNKDIPKSWWAKRVWELPVYWLRGPKVDKFNQYQSLRKTMVDLSPEPMTESEANMQPLQLGR